MQSENSPRGICPFGNPISRQPQEMVQPNKLIKTHGLSVQLNNDPSYSCSGITSTAAIYDGPGRKGLEGTCQQLSSI